MGLPGCARLGGWVTAIKTLLYLLVLYVLYVTNLNDKRSLGVLRLKMTKDKSELRAGS